MKEYRNGKPAYSRSCWDSPGTGIRARVAQGLALLGPGGDMLHSAGRGFDRLSRRRTLWRALGAPRHDAFPPVRGGRGDSLGLGIWTSFPAALEAVCTIVRNYCFSRDPRCHDQWRARSRLFRPFRYSSIFLFLEADQRLADRRPAVFQLARAFYPGQRDDLGMAACAGTWFGDSRRAWPARQEGETRG